MNKSICIISQSHLCKNPRVLKEAIALEANGNKITIVNSIFSKKLYQQDLDLVKGLNIQIKPISDLRFTNLSSILDKLIRRTGFFFVEKIKIENTYAIGYGISRYLQNCININANLYIGHQEVGLFVGTQLLKRKYTVAFDFEDWYTEDLLEKDKQKRPLNFMRRLEDYALKNANITYTTSKCLAVSLAKTYNAPEPKVVYNVFDNDENIHKDKKFNDPVKLVWFSQTIGEGRGLEEFIELMVNSKANFELNLIGEINLNYKNLLVSKTQNKFLITFHELVKPNHLLKKLTEFDIGLALEQTTPASRNLTITNKFFQYLNAGLPIICSKTEGQEEIFNLHQPGIMLNDKSSDLNDIDEFLTDERKLNYKRQMAIKTAITYHWQNEKMKLINYLERV